jgi:hypothetical protein
VTITQRVPRQARQCHQAVHDRHLHVQRDHVRVMFGDRAQGRRAVGDVRDHGQVGLQAQEGGDRLPGQPLVVGEHEPDHASTAATENVPGRSPGPAVSSPPASAARRRRPASTPSLTTVSAVGRTVTQQHRVSACRSRFVTASRRTRPSSSLCREPVDASSVRAPVGRHRVRGRAAAPGQLAHVVERAAGQPSHLGHLRVRPVRVDRREAGGQLALHDTTSNAWPRMSCRSSVNPQPLPGRAKLCSVTPGQVQLDRDAPLPQRDHLREGDREHRDQRPSQRIGVNDHAQRGDERDDPVAAGVALALLLSGPADLVARGWSAGVVLGDVPVAPLDLASSVLWLGVAGLVINRAFRWEPRA